jgi:nucleotide-binding universal stress UspA family protein
VTDTTAFASIPMDAGWEVMYNLIKEEGNKATSYVKDLAKSMELDTESVIIEGNPGIEIIKFSEENEIDVIVIGKTGKSMLDKFLLGSVADKVIRKSKIPVLVIRG